MYRLASVLIMVAGLSPSVLAAAASPDAEAWLGRMATAVRELNYDGIFTYMRGFEMDTVRIVHRYEDGREQERMVHLNGDMREIIRRDQVLVCHHARGDSTEADHSVPIGPFGRALFENLPELRDYYRLAMGRADRVANRPAVRLSILPKNADRYGYRLWLDKETGLLLESRLVHQGRPLEIFQFSRVEIAAKIPPRSLAPGIRNPSMRHNLTVDEAAADGALVEERRAVRPDWRPSFLPSGFRSRMAASPNGVLYTDGLASFSVFVERVSKGDIRELSTQVGGTVVITRPVRGSTHRITIVGELPISTARRIAESVERVTY